MADTFDTSLVAAGWTLDAAGEAWTLNTPAGRATLAAAGESGAWQWHSLFGGAVPTCTLEALLEANHRLPGPVKFVGSGNGVPVLRVDVPVELLDAGSRSFWCELGSDAWEQWAAAITRVAMGNADGSAIPDCSPGSSVTPAGNALAPEVLLEQLQESGFAGSVEDGRVFVHVNRANLFRQVCVDQNGRGGVVSVELADWDAFPDESRPAARKLALAANARLPLVRLSIDEEVHPRRLCAEVHFGRALIPGAWLTTALEAVETAVALTAQEFSALRDPELARLVLT